VIARELESEEYQLKRSTDRILTTHVGSLARPPELSAMIRGRETGQPHDEADLESRIDEAVRDVVRRQAEAGIDIIDDGEQGKLSFNGYVNSRLEGFELRPSTEAWGGPWAGTREAAAFPEFYARNLPQMPAGGGTAGSGMGGTVTCVGPVKYKGHAAVKADLERLKAAANDVRHEELFMPSLGAGYIAATRPNEYFGSEEEYHQVLADAMHEEYCAIIDAGLTLQIDEPRMIMWWTMHPDKSIEDARVWAQRSAEITNYSLRDIPRDRVRFHTCYGIDIGPRLYDIELKHVIDNLLTVNAGAYSFEASNPRHEHEYHVWENVKLRDGQILIPGIISHTTNLVEHPGLIAERIRRYARIAGRENVIAGADCGFAAGGGGLPDIHPTVVWAKFDALAEGARLAWKELWS
jgi:5-methyltetrahydropteroyltriglutamate--homocysteine methyltransferase